MFDVIGTIIFGAVIGVLARIVIAGYSSVWMDCDRFAWGCRRLDRLLGVGASRWGQHLWPRLDPLGDQRSWSGDLGLCVFGDDP